MGKGDFIINMALVNPKINFIGIELHTNVIARACKKLENLELPNLRLINVNALEFFIPIIYKRVKQIAANMKPMYVTSKTKIKAGTDQMTTFYADQINHLVEEFKQEILAEQRKLDNRQHYQYESEVCQRYNQKHHR